MADNDNAIDIILRLQDELSPALAKAQQAIRDAAKDIVTGTTEASSAWASFIGHLDIESAISHPLDTARAAVDAFAETLGPAAVAAAAMASAIILLEKEAYELTLHAAEAGGGIYDASLKMSASVPAVSTLKFAVDAAGGSLDKLASLAFVMQERMQQNPTEFTKGLKDLHINSAAFLDLDVDQRVLAISTAMRAAGADTNLQATAMELFGRQGRDGLALLMKPLADLDQMGKDLGFTLTEVDAKAADELLIKSRILGLQWDKLKTDVGSQLIPVLQFLEDHLGTIGKAAASLGGVDIPMLSTAYHGLGIEAEYARAALDVLLGRTDAVPTVTGDAAKGLLAMHDRLKDLQIYMPTLTDAFLAQDEAMRDLDPATRKLITAYTEMNAAGIGWQGTLNTLDGTVVEAIRFYLQAGVSQQVLADAYGLTAVQVKAVASSVADDLAAEKNLDAFRHDAHNRQVEILRIQLDEQNKLKDVVNAAILSEIAAQTRLNAAWGLDATGAIKMQKSALDILTDKLTQLHLQKVEGISQSAQEQVLIDDYTRSLYSEAQAADAVIQAMVSKASETAAAMEADRAATAASEAAFLSYKNSISLTAASLDDLNAQLKAFYDHLAALGPLGVNTGGGIGSFGGPSAQTLWSPSAQSRDSGGPVMPGHPYYVGTGAQPELFIPSTPGTMVPAGAGGGGGDTHVHFHGTIIGTNKQELTRLINEGQHEGLKGRGMRGI